jgi:hypothetical protein
MRAEESPKFVIWIPAIEPRRRVEHCVTFSQVAATVQARDAIYTSLCGIRFAPAAPMTAPPWPHCSRCTLIYQQWTETWQKQQNQSRRARRFRLLPGRPATESPQTEPAPGLGPHGVRTLFSTTLPPGAEPT